MEAGSVPARDAGRRPCLASPPCFQDPACKYPPLRSDFVGAHPRIDWMPSCVSAASSAMLTFESTRHLPKHLQKTLVSNHFTPRPPADAGSGIADREQCTTTIREGLMTDEYPVVVASFSYLRLALANLMASGIPGAIASDVVYGKWMQSGCGNFAACLHGAFRHFMRP